MYIYICIYIYIFDDISVFDCMTDGIHRMTRYHAMASGKKTMKTSSSTGMYVIDRNSMPRHVL